MNTHCMPSAHTPPTCTLAHRSNTPCLLCTYTHPHTFTCPTKTDIRTKPRTHVDTHTHLSMGGLMYSPWPPSLTSSNCLIQDTYASLDCTSPRLGTCTQTHTHTPKEKHMPLLQALKPSKQDKVKLSLYDMQWNLSIVDTTGTQLAVLYRDELLIQR